MEHHLTNFTRSDTHDHDLNLDNIKTVFISDNHHDDFLIFPDNDVITPDSDVDVDFNFDFTFDDISFADDLLVDPNYDPVVFGSGEVARVIDSLKPDPNSSEGSNFAGNSDVLINDDCVDRFEFDRKIIRVDDCEISNQNSSNCSVSCDSVSNSVQKKEIDHAQEIRVKSECNSVLKSKRKKEIGDDHGGEIRSSKFRKTSEEDVDEGEGKSMLKSIRKKETEGRGNAVEIRTDKCKKSSLTTSLNVGEVGETERDYDEGFSMGGGGDEDERRKARLIRNRESAHLSRQRKKKYVEELEDKVKLMVSTITDLNGRISYFMSENATLRQQLSGGVVGPPHGMYPMQPMGYPRMPCHPGGYMVKPMGSHVPLVPIPRLKPQHPAPAPKVKKSKKVASVSLFGLLLLFMLLFGGLLPMVNVRVQKGTVFTVHSHVNASDPLVASLYVPRNDKLVKIDGNLIIHSVLASEKAKIKEETGLAIHRSYPPYPTPGPGSNDWRRPHLDRNQNGHQRAIASVSASADGFTPIASDGKLQQWFREGLAGPMLSSEMCTEVFQFDISPTPGSIVPATSITSEDRLNSTRHNKTVNRRILHKQAIPLKDDTHNTTKDHVQPREQNDGLQNNKSHPSVVVSVLVDPREVGEGVIGSKSLSRIFVVVLIDSVKYVTYSCMLPFMGSGSHL